MMGTIVCRDAGGEAKLRLGITGVNDGSAITEYIDVRCANTLLSGGKSMRAHDQYVFFGRYITVSFIPDGTTSKVTLDGEEVKTLQLMYTGDGWSCHVIC